MIALLLLVFVQTVIRYEAIRVILLEQKYEKIFISMFLYYDIISVETLDGLL